jgi:hypothetical protein
VTDLYAAAEAAGRCECGVPLEGHPPLPKPLPWAHGRPCGRLVDGRRYRDGRRRHVTGQAFVFGSKATERARAS